jgi:Putative heavy-metal-binding
MNGDVAQVQCPRCLHIGQESNREATSWDCPRGYSYYFRRCSSCRAVSLVTSIQRRGEPWHCTWCNAINQGFSSRNDPAGATVGDLAVDMASHGLEFKRRQPPYEQARDTVPVLIVTTNEVPSYRITHVHGDVFGLIVRACNYFSNVGAQLRTLAGGEVCPC